MLEKNVICCACFPGQSLFFKLKPIQSFPPPFYSCDNSGDRDSEEKWKYMSQLLTKGFQEKGSQSYKIEKWRG